MKTEVILKRVARVSDSKDEDSSDLSEPTVSEYEQYSPTDFIIQPSSKAGKLGLSAAGGKSHKPASHAVIRPIPIIPLDSSIYSTPPTYIDTLPIVTLPMVPPQLLGGQGHTQESLIQAQQVGHQANGSPGKLVPLHESMFEDGEPLMCRWMNCEETFSVMEELVNHVNDHHVRVERPDVEYQCKWDRCPRRGKGFNARYKMLIHIRTHTNEKPHKCSICAKSFSRLENLKIHNRSHTGEKPYSCPFPGCNKAYSNSSDRFKHVRTHQEDKPYICKMPGCNKRYTDPSSLRKHVRTHGHQCKVSGQRKRAAEQSSSNALCENNTVMCMPAGLTKLCPMSPNSLLLPVSQSPSLCLSSSFSTGSFENAGIGSLLHVPTLTANPLLSSTVISVQRHVLSTQTDKGNCLLSVSDRENLKMPNSIVSATDMKGQGGPDSPLDLSTGPSSPTIIIGTRDMELGTSPHSNGQDRILGEGNQWEIIQTET